MKPLSLNLSQMKKIAGDKDSSTFQHPSGHQMRIIHGAVSALQRKQLESMPVHNYADGGTVQKDGGTVQKDDVPEPSKQGSAQMQAGATSGSTTPSQAWSNLKSGLGFANGGDTAGANTIGNPTDPITQVQAALARGGSQEAFDEDMRALPASPEQADMPPANGPQIASAGPVTPDQVAAMPGSAPGVAAGQETTTPEEAAPPAPDAVAAGMAAPVSGNFETAYNQGQAAITEQQKVNEAKAKADAEVQAQDLLNRQSLNQGLQQNYQDFVQHRQQFMKDVAGDAINPNHYFENMSTPGKVASMIGLLLGGFSTAFTHGSNPAMDFINRQIDRDIESQRSRLDRDKTLLGANQANWQDDLTHNNMTRVNMNDIYDRKIQQRASELGTPQAKAIADAAHAQLGMQSAQLLQQSAIRQTVMQHLKQGGTGLTAMDLASAGMIPQADALKEQASIDSQKKALASAGEIFRKYDQEQTAGNTLNPQSYKRVAGINAELTNLIMESDASKRLTPESAQLEVKPFWVKTTDDQETRASKLRGIGNLIRQHAAPTPYMSKYAPQSIPQYDQAPMDSREGQTGTLPNGQRVIMRGGKIVPYSG